MLQSVFKNVKNGETIYAKIYSERCTVPAAHERLFFVSLGADASSVQAFIQKSLACGAAVFFTQLVTKRPFFHRSWAVPLFVMGWWYLYLVIKYFFLNASADISYADEIITGTGGATGFMVLQYICEKHIKLRGLCFLWIWRNFSSVCRR